jgi:hypothetical protein
MSEGEAEAPLILIRRLTRARRAAIRDCGRTHGATLNDLALTALYRRLFRLLDLESGAELTIPIMVDMRRYLADGEEFTGRDQFVLGAACGRSRSGAGSALWGSQREFCSRFGSTGVSDLSGSRSSVKEPQGYQGRSPWLVPS